MERSRWRTALELNHRAYQNVLEETLQKQNVMLFLMGARQVGKTTLSKIMAESYGEHTYLNWDIDEHREMILSGQRFIEKIFTLHRPLSRPLVIFDEIHKYKNWKNFLKGFYDLYKDQFAIVVTGSAHLNVYQKGGDSLMGRYLPFTIFPFSLGELNQTPVDGLFKKPFETSKENFDALYDFGGFPTPFLQRDEMIYNQWRRNRQTQLFKEDIRDLSHIHEISQLELCATLLSHQSGNILNRSTVATKLAVSVQTINRWIETLRLFYYVFTLPPWTTNIPHSLIKEPKIYLCDWSLVKDPGARFETLVACALKKTITFWNECGFGNFDLFFLRDKSQREVDFLVSKEGKPWFLVEAKTSSQALSPALKYYQEKTGAPFAFQVTKNMDYIDYDCFSKEGCFVVPALTFLSQI